MRFDQVVADFNSALELTNGPDGSRIIVAANEYSLPEVVGFAEGFVRKHDGFVSADRSWRVRTDMNPLMNYQYSSSRLIPGRRYLLTVQDRNWWEDCNAISS